MPEGDTIWRAATMLHECLRGRMVTSARPVALARLTGRVLQRVEPVGKHLYMHFDGGPVLHSHMRMHGAWHVDDTDRQRRRPGDPITAVLEFGDTTAVLVAAPVCELVPAAAVGSGLGPDTLSPQFAVAAAVARARLSTRPTVAEVLLEQSVVAGIGNIHRCNALWHEGIDPMTPVGELDDARLTQLLMRARDLLRRGAVGDNFRSRNAVHGRSGRPCAACGTLVQAAPLGRPPRILYWCPRCQSGIAGLPQLRGSTT